MLIWRGWGLIMIVPVVAGYAGTYLFTELIASDPDYFWKHAWIKLVGTLVAASLIKLAVKVIDWRASTRLVVDAKTGEVEDLNEDRSSLFFIPVRFLWPIVLVVGGIWSLT
jgi:hypothetical protein